MYNSISENHNYPYSQESVNALRELGLASFRSIFERRGKQFDGSGNTNCINPSHEDRNPSMSVTDGEGCFCHACGFKAKDPIKLIQELDGINSYKEAIEVTAKEFNYPLIPNPLYQKNSQNSNNNNSRKPLQNIDIATQSIPDDIPEKVSSGRGGLTIYPYSQSQWVVRIDSENGSKKCIPHHRDSRGNDVAKKGSDQWFPYRIEDVAANANSGYPLLVEGEQCVEVARSKGLVASTFIGSGWGNNDLEQNLQALKDVGISGLVFWPDNDEPGFKKAWKTKEIGDRIGLEIIIVDPLSSWSEMPEKGDIADFIEAHPSISGEGLINRLKLASELRLSETEELNPKPNPKNKVVRHPSSPQLSAENLRQTLTDFIESNPSRVQVQETLPNLATAAGWTDSQIRKLYEELERELEKDSEWAESKNKADKFRQIRKKSLTFSNDWAGINPELARAFNLRAQALGVSESAVMTALYPVAASLIPCHSQLLLIKATDGYAKPIIYAGLNAKSAGLKSPTMKLVLNALFKLQSEANERYQQALEEWAEECAATEGRKPPKPIPKDFYTTDATSEAVAKIQADNIHSGFLGWFDELMGLIKSANAYRGGRGADAEKLLSGKDGTGIKVDRVGKKLYAPISAYSILGGTQPDVLNAAMGDLSDSQGQWARFWWCYMPAKRRPFPNTPYVDITSILYEAYKRLQCQMANTYELSNEAYKLFVNFYNELDELAYKEPRQGLATVYGKWKFDVGIIALVQHCFSAASNNQEPGLHVSADTMRCAINQARFYIDQVKFIHGEAETNLGDNQAGIIDKLTELSERIGWVKAADFRDNFKAFRNQFSPDDVRTLFQKLASDGVGIVQGSGARLQWRTTDEGSSPTANSGQTQGNSGQTQGNSGQTQGISETIISKEFEDNNLKNSGQTQGQLRAGSNSYIPMDLAQKSKTQGSERHFSTQGGDFPQIQGANEKPTLSTLSLDSEVCNHYSESDTAHGKNSGQATLSYPEYPEFCSTPSEVEPQDTTPPKPTPEQQKWDSLNEGNVIIFEERKYELDLYNHHENYWLIYSIPDENERQLHPSDIWEFSAD